jgi:nucleoid DNA-binding protein
MEVKFEIGTLNNAQGKGIARKYIRLQQEEPMTDDELASAIEHECTLSRADIKAVFEALRYHVTRSLSSGRRFHLPKLGYFSLAASLTNPKEQLTNSKKQKQQRKITGRDISLRGINFQPEDSLMSDLRLNVNFTKAKYTGQSVAYLPDELWAKVSGYLSTHRYLTCRIMRSTFGLSERKAREWLALFVQQGHLTKEGTAHRPLYFLAQ